MLRKHLFLSFTTLVFLTACSSEAMPAPLTDSESAISFDTTEQVKPSESIEGTTAENLPNATDLPLNSVYIEINNNIPVFSDDEIANNEPYANFSTLDSLGRSGTALAYLDTSLMPDSERGSISSIYPSGWDQGNYDTIDSGGWLYNRSHLIGHQLTGDDDPENLITGTRQFNVDGMLPFENYVAQYIETTEKPVLYRVTPIYEGNNLLPHGVQMEGYSPLDDGEGIQFNIFVPNQQNGITINYADGSHSVN